MKLVRRQSSSERERSEREREAVRRQQRELDARLDRVCAQVQQLTPVPSRA